MIDVKATYIPSKPPKTQKHLSKNMLGLFLVLKNAEK